MTERINRLHETATVTITSVLAELIHCTVPHSRAPCVTANGGSSMYINQIMLVSYYITSGCITGEFPTVVVEQVNKMEKKTRN